MGWKVKAIVAAGSGVNGPLLTPQQMVQILMSTKDTRDLVRDCLAEFDAAKAEGRLPPWAMESEAG